MKDDELRKLFNEHVAHTMRSDAERLVTIVATQRFISIHMGKLLGRSEDDVLNEIQADEKRILALMIGNLQDGSPKTAAWLNKPNVDTSGE